MRLFGSVCMVGGRTYTHTVHEVMVSVNELGVSNVTCHVEWDESPNLTTAVRCFPLYCAAKLRCGLPALDIGATGNDDDVVHTAHFD